MPRTAKCKYCGKPVITSEGYKVVVSGRNIYYCNEQEYRKAITPSLTRNSVLAICNEILSSPTDSVLCKELNEWLKIADINKILAYLTEYKVYVSNQMERKTFSSYYGKVRYFSAIVKNSFPSIRCHSLISKKTSLKYARSNLILTLASARVYVSWRRI